MNLYDMRLVAKVAYEMQVRLNTVSSDKNKSINRNYVYNYQSRNIVAKSGLIMLVK